MAEEASFVKLNNDNYIHWSFRMKMVLIEKDLWVFVNPGAVVPEGEDENAQREIDGHLQKALALMSLNIEDDQLVHVQNASNGRIAWENLRGVHQRDSTGTNI